MSPQHKEKIRDIVEAGQWDAINAAIQDMIEKHESDLRNCKIDTSSRDITLKKARLEGVQNVQRFMSQFGEKYKDG
jgi:N-acetylmuramoyl-L-alanine amidase CwlA